MELFNKLKDVASDSINSITDSLPDTKSMLIKQATSIDYESMITTVGSVGITLLPIV